MPISIINCALIAVLAAAVIGCVWANHHMLMRSRASGGRFWVINPMAYFAAMTMRHTAIYFACWIVAVAAFICLIGLNHGWDELTAAGSSIRAGPKR
jgi:hypothetical protein